MSIALDFALFMRNSVTKLGLTLTNQAVGFKLSHRIGSNTDTWVDQKTLAEECDMYEQNLTKHTNALVKSKIFKWRQNPRDKRRKIYSFNPVLKNYAQMSDSEKSLVHKKLGDTYRHATVDKSENTSAKAELILINTSAKAEVISGDSSAKPELSRQKKSLGSPVAVRLEKNKKSPKETLKQRNICNQTNREPSGSVFLKPYPEDFCPNDASYLELEKHSRRTNCSYKELLDKFERVMVAYRKKSTNWQQTFCEFLANEHPKKVYEDMQGRKRRYDGLSTNY